AGGKSKKMFTGEEVENIKNLIARQGKLEFRILANSTDDGPAMEAARAYYASKDPAIADARDRELRRAALKNEPPPPPRAADGSLMFTVRVGGEETNHTYSWV